jgi:hypothetical protein
LIAALTPSAAALTTAFYTVGSFAASIAAFYTALFLAASNNIVF